jgi:hypothetical protein|tara:strand:- start:171 stop:542 length:372 start_codon:yes stop_codon:yes gene_type:complete
MALGNANSQAQSRGKNKPVVVKRRKEVVLGKGLFTGTVNMTPFGDINKPLNACNLSAPDTTVFHDGGGNDFDGIVVGTKVYTRRRVNDKFTLSVDGAYKALNDRGDNVSITIVNGAITALNRC